MKFAVGSKNPVKISAVANAVKKVWKDADVIGVEVDHGTGVQPTSNEAGLKGATLRAELCLKQADSDFGVGIEGNTEETGHGMLLQGWVVIVNRQGEKGIANCGGFLLPERVAKEVRKGRELGPVMDELAGVHNTKQKMGSTGILTNGLISRTEAFEKGVIFALARFLNPQYYD